MDKMLLQKIVSKATDETKSLTQQIIDIFYFVRDIPYGDIGSRKPEDVYLQNQGTCSGKHELFKEICQFKGIEVKEGIVIHRFINLPIKFPQNIKNILQTTDIVDPHNLLKIKLDNNWLTVDLTRDLPMKELGFPVNENWDGKTDQQICAVPDGEIIELADAIAFKTDFISTLSDQQREQRKFFLQEFTKWLDNRRKTTSMAKKFMKIAIQEAKKAPYPYAAVLVKDEKIISKAGTSSENSFDPTAHAEIIAIREACLKLKTNNLDGVALYTTVEPCPMCFSAAWWAGISKIYFGISLKESSKLLFPEMDVTSHYLNEHSGNKIEIVGGILLEEIRALFRKFKKHLKQ